MRGGWVAKNNPRDYGIARSFEAGLRDWKTVLATLIICNSTGTFCVYVKD